MSVESLKPAATSLVVDDDDGKKTAHDRMTFWFF